MLRALVSTLLIILAACGGDAPLPEAEPLSVPRESVERLYGARPGPHRPVVARDLVLEVADRDAALHFNLYYPAEGDSYPLLLFSHGNWSDKDSYDRLLEHWASHGYAILAANHADCCGAPRGIFNSLRYGQLGLVTRRAQDLSLLLAGLADIERLHPPFRGVADPSRLAVAGHSFGAFTAQQLGGAGARDPDTGEYLHAREPRVRAVVALSPPGPMFDIITAESWQQLSTPTLVSTGTWDIQPSFWPDWRMHLMSFENSPPGDKIGLVIEGADHYLGNLICRTGRDAVPQEDALTLLQISTTAFLDAHMKGSQQAAQLLEEGRLDRETAGFARLSRR